MRWLIRKFFRLVHLVLGPLLLLGDWLTTPKGIQRSSAQQQAVDADTAALSLYQFRTCPFCIKTRRAIKRLSLRIETRDAQHDPEHRQALLDGGGQIKVPCLRIADASGGDQWLYESSDIIDYLNGRFSA